MLHVSHVLVPPPQEQASELMDLPQPRPVMEAYLADLERVNVFLGVRGLVWRHLRQFVRPGDRDLTIADVGTGGADLPRAFARWARRLDLTIRTIAIDNHPTTALIARDRSRVYPEIRVVQGAADALPLGNRSVDVSLFTTGLHHLARPDAVRALRELDRVSRRGFIVTDLVRAWGAYLGARALSLFLLRSPLTRVDGPRSVLRSYTVREARVLIRDAGLPGVRLIAHPLFRLALVKGA